MMLADNMRRDQRFSEWTHGGLTNIMQVHCNWQHVAWRAACSVGLAAGLGQADDQGHTKTPVTPGSGGLHAGGLLVHVTWIKHSRAWGMQCGTSW